MSDHTLIILTEILWKKNIISTQEYENVVYGEYARDLSKPEHWEYQIQLEHYRDKVNK